MDKAKFFVSKSDISICALVDSEALVDQLTQHLVEDCYCCLNLPHQDEFLSVVNAQKHQIDCLIFQENPTLHDTVHELHIAANILPSVILVDVEPKIERQRAQIGMDTPSRQAIYHKAEVRLPMDELKYLTGAVSQAVNQFMRLAIFPASSRQIEDQAEPKTYRNENKASQGQLLSEKLNERLGYLGFFYKRSSSHFYRNLSSEAQQAFMKELRTKYREIIVNYFHEESAVNQQIDSFVNMVFFADLPTAQIIEMHMDLMEILGNQLKVQGRNEELLLGYRLTLIDTIAHLCEMYRRSIRQVA